MLRRWLGRFKGYKLLEGYRGVRGDVGAVVDLLLKLNEVVEKEGIVEMDLNPVFVYERGAVVADARIVVGERKRFEMDVGDISFFFKARSVAVIGASTNPIKVGNSVVRSLMSNKNLRIYPINPNASEILGLKAYPSVKSLPEVPDIAIVTVPAEFVLDAVREAAEAGVKGVVIISSGFKEAEVEEGKVREERLREIARKYGIRIVGPNTFGIVSVVGGINASFTPMFSEVKKGRIALVSQSGGICHYIIHKFRDSGFSHILHLGNRCDVDFPDVMRFLREDENTDVVAVYVEGIDNGRGLFEELKRLCSEKKVVVMKSGRSSVADKASVSHTGSMAGDYRVFASAMKQAGAVVVETPTELIDTAIAMEKFEVSGGVAVLTIQAGLGIVAADIIESSGGRLARFGEETVRKLKSLLPPITLRENPVDLSFSGLNLKVFAEVIDTVCRDDDVGLVMFLYAVAPPSWVLPAEVISQIMGRITKPSILGYSSTPENYAEIKEALKGSKTLIFDSVERAAKVAAILSEKRNYF
ncbi:CoA-binding protein [Archaeoglobus fulgidus]|nr:CoA-binding protein [Archaeoglobus fulgidus]